MAKSWRKNWSPVTKNALWRAIDLTSWYAPALSGISLTNPPVFFYEDVVKIIMEFNPTINNQKQGLYLFHWDFLPLNRNHKICLKSEVNRWPHWSYFLPFLCIYSSEEYHFLNSILDKDIGVLFEVSYRGPPSFCDSGFFLLSKSLTSCLMLTHLFSLVIHSPDNAPKWVSSSKIRCHKKMVSHNQVILQNAMHLIFHLFLGIYSAQ